MKITEVSGIQNSQLPLLEHSKETKGKLCQNYIKKQHVWKEQWELVSSAAVDFVDNVCKKEAFVDILIFLAFNVHKTIIYRINPEQSLVKSNDTYKQD
jgi:hypothetical protein